ncbi:MAG TPA: penicillin-binding protein 2 [Firmicutes bacterium]|nr:penicillin-binding protein 2 [Bacillota bacterium]
MYKRMLAVFISIVIIMTTCSFRLMYLTSSSDVQAANYGSGYKLEISRGRGTIYDYNLVPITNDSIEYVALVPPTPQAIMEISDQLDAETAQSVLERLKSGNPVATVVSSGFLSEGCTVVKTFKRYSSTQPAAHIIGYVNSDNIGTAGIEKAYEDILSRPSALTATYRTDAKGNILSGTEPEIDYSGYNLSAGIALTIDKGLQEAVELAASRYLSAGAVVVLDIGTGKIRAMCSLPEFDQYNVAQSLEDESSPLINRALLNYNVGSVYKLVVAAAALEHGISPDTMFSCSGSYTVGNKTFHCLGKHGSINMETALEVSCNIYFIQLARSFEPESILGMSRSAGFERSMYLCAGISSDAGLLPSLEVISTQPAALANLSFGQGDLMLTPLHMAGFISAIASGGYYYEPSLIEGLVDDKGKLYNASAPQAPAKILSSSTASILREFMINAVESGTGTAAKPESGGAGGKTATAETGWIKDGREVYQTWFTGFFPAENPQYAVVVLAEDGDSGSRTSAPVFKLIADYVSSRQ